MSDDHAAECTITGGIDDTATQTCLAEIARIRERLDVLEHELERMARIHPGSRLRLV